jgi:hypothetical protein
LETDGIKEEFPGMSYRDAFGASDKDESPPGYVASEELVLAAIKLMKKQQVNNCHLGTDFDNATLIEFYAYLKSIALGLPREEFEFDTRIDETKLLQKAKNEIGAFLDCLPSDVHKAKVQFSRKRTLDLTPDDSGIDWKELYENDEVASCKIDQLKKRLRSLGMVIFRLLIFVFGVLYCYTYFV